MDEVGGFLGRIFTMDFLKFFLPLLAGVVAWLVNERWKRKAEEYARKEERYQGLILSLPAFFEGRKDGALQEEFIRQFTLCWLYCSDEVIEAANSFIDMLQTSGDNTVKAKNAAAGKLMGAIRRDLLSRKIVRKTKLSGAEYRLVSVVPQGQGTSL